MGNLPIDYVAAFVAFVGFVVWLAKLEFSNKRCREDNEILRAAIDKVESDNNAKVQRLEDELNRKVDRIADDVKDDFNHLREDFRDLRRLIERTVIANHHPVET